MPLPQVCVVLFLLSTIEAGMPLPQNRGRDAPPTVSTPSLLPSGLEWRCLYAYCTGRYNPPAAG